jgi:hypothetical protein
MRNESHWNNKGITADSGKAKSNFSCGMTPRDGSISGSKVTAPQDGSRRGEIP